MSREAFYETIYHRNDWTVADAFRPQPGWGCRRFITRQSAFGSVTEQELLEGAKEAAPAGYRLTRLSAIPESGPVQVIWSTPPDHRFVAGKATAPQPAGARHG